MGKTFYDDGLRFTCARCSGCCRGAPGFVFLTKDDVKRLLARLDLDFHTFLKRYCRLVDTGDGHSLSLTEKPGYDCVFWTGSGCSVYEDRPVQCSTYPFWSSIMESAEAWRREAADCPGMGRGELRTKEYIEERLWKRRAEGRIVIPAELAKRPEDIDADSILGSSGLGPEPHHAV